MLNFPLYFLVMAIYINSFASWALFCENYQVSDVKTIPLIDKLPKENSADPETELKNWLLSTATFTGATSIDLDVKLRQSNKGKSNFGIFDVIRRTSSATSKYIIKKTFCAEVEHLWKLNDTIITHPECLEQKGVDPALIAKLPVITKIVESARSIAPGEDNICFALLESAQGYDLSDIVRNSLDIQKIRTAFERVGQSIGSMHSLMAQDKMANFDDRIMWNHDDMHNENVFYDELTDQVYLIDNEQLDGGKRGSFVKTSIQHLVNFERGLSLSEREIFQFLNNKLASIEKFAYLQEIHERSYYQSKPNEEVNKAFQELLSRNSSIFSPEMVERMHIGEAMRHQIALSAFVKAYVGQFSSQQDKENIVSFFSKLCSGYLNTLMLAGPFTEQTFSLLKERILGVAELEQCSRGEF